MQDTLQTFPIAELVEPDGRSGSTVIVIAASTMLMAVTQLIQTSVFWIVNRHDVSVVVHLTPWLGMLLQLVTPIALSTLLAASIGLLEGKQWGRPLYAWTAVVWMLAVTCLTYWIMMVVNLPMYLLAIYLLYRKGGRGDTAAEERRGRLCGRRVASLACLALSSVLHFLAWVAAISPSSWVWRLMPRGHPWHLLLPGAILFVVGVVLADRSTRLRSAGVALMVFCVAMGNLLVASIPVSTSLYRYLPEPRAHGNLPYNFMITYIVLLGTLAASLLRASRHGGGKGETPSGLRQTDCILFSLALARVTFARMSDAFAVQMNGFG